MKFRIHDQRHGRFTVLFGIVISFVFVLSLLASSAPAEAVRAQDFNAGNIISDANFYNGNAMSTSEVQSFLNAKVPRCTIGEPGRGAGSVWGSTTIAYSCLRNFSMTTTSIPANAYCSAYPWRVGETSAQIIAKVGKACGISQRVLLITLEKEQSLVTDTWPTARQFEVATGYDCPDSGPGGTANCNSAYFGFSTQLYYAAWQLKVYRAHIDNYRYKPFQINTIQWHPNIGCGTSQVYIENWATASLYIYTPYRPNRAALNAGWGTGDACSAYGNRNFFLFYLTWFGDPHASGAPGQSAIDARYSANVWLGSPTSGYNQSTSSGGGTIRGYQNGAITWTPTSGAKVLAYQTRDYHAQNGGISGVYGWPTSESTKHQGSRWVQRFQRGDITLLNGIAHGVRGDVLDIYETRAKGYPGPLGWPTTDQSGTGPNLSQRFENGSITVTNGTGVVDIPAITQLAESRRASVGAVTSTPLAQLGNGGGFVQGHQHAAIAWSRSNGAHVIQGKIRDAHRKSGGVNGALGWPTSAENTYQSNGGGSVQAFQNAAIATSQSGTWLLTGQMRTEYNAQGSFMGALGWPTSNVNTISSAGGGKVQGFQGGALIQRDGSSSIFSLIGANRVAFNDAGSFGRGPGWPLSNETPFAANGGGTVQGFQNAAILQQTNANQSFILSGDFRAAYTRQGGVTHGSLGWPISNAEPVAGGTVQHFQHGVIAQRTGASSPVTLSAEHYRKFIDQGGFDSTLGWPTSDATAFNVNGGGTVQGFQNAATLSSASGTFVLAGELRERYSEQGGIHGPIGWPTSDEVCENGVCTQTYQNGTLTTAPPVLTNSKPTRAPMADTSTDEETLRSLPVPTAPEP